MSTSTGWRGLGVCDMVCISWKAPCTHRKNIKEGTNSVFTWQKDQLDKKYGLSMWTDRSMETDIGAVVKERFISEEYSLESNVEEEK